MSKDNNGSQSGDGSINVGVGDFRGAHVHVGGSNPTPTFTPEQLEIVRHPALGGRGVKSGNLSTFGLVTGAASLIGLYLTIFPLFSQPKYSSWSTLFLFLLVLAVTSLAVSAVVKRKKFEHFVLGKYYLESGNRDSIYLNSFTARCPWCTSKMHLRNVGPKDGPRDDMFICERNPRQHTILLDPTLLPEIVEADS